MGVAGVGVAGVGGVGVAGVGETLRLRSADRNDSRTGDHCTGTRFGRSKAKTADKAVNCNANVPVRATAALLEHTTGTHMRSVTQAKTYVHSLP